MFPLSGIENNEENVERFLNSFVHKFLTTISKIDFFLSRISEKREFLFGSDKLFLMVEKSLLVILLQENRNGFSFSLKNITFVV